MWPYRVCIPFSSPYNEKAFFLQVEIIRKGAMSKGNISKHTFLKALNSDNISLSNLVE
jgi:hypothetical protein